MAPPFICNMNMFQCFCLTPVPRKQFATLLQPSLNNPFPPIEMKTPPTSKSTETVIAILSIAYGVQILQNGIFSFKPQKRSSSAQKEVHQSETPTATQSSESQPLEKGLKVPKTLKLASSGPFIEIHPTTPRVKKAAARPSLQESTPPVPEAIPYTPAEISGSQKETSIHEGISSLPAAPASAPPVTLTIKLTVSMSPQGKGTQMKSEVQVPITSVPDVGPQAPSQSQTTEGKENRQEHSTGKSHSKWRSRLRDRRQRKKKPQPTAQDDPEADIPKPPTAAEGPEGHVQQNNAETKESAETVDGNGGNVQAHPQSTAPSEPAIQRGPRKPRGRGRRNRRGPHGSKEANQRVQSQPEKSTPTVSLDPTPTPGQRQQGEEDNSQAGNTTSPAVLAPINGVPDKAFGSSPSVKPVQDNKKNQARGHGKGNRVDLSTHTKPQAQGEIGMSSAEVPQSSEQGKDKQQGVSVADIAHPKVVAGAKNLPSLQVGHGGQEAKGQENNGGNIRILQNKGRGVNTSGNQAQKVPALRTPETKNRVGGHTVVGQRNAAPNSADGGSAVKMGISEADSRAVPINRESESGTECLFGALSPSRFQTSSQDVRNDFEGPPRAIKKPYVPRRRRYYNSKQKGSIN